VILCYRRAVLSLEQDLTVLFVVYFIVDMIASSNVETEANIY